MSTLIPLTTRTAYIPGVNNIGVIWVDAHHVVLVDSGIDKDAARNIRKICTQAGANIVAVISTHHHADHIGGNDYLVRNISGIEIYASRLEAPLIENPMLEPMYLSYGATPIAPLKNRFVMAAAAPVHHRVEADTVMIAGVELAIVPVPGHSLAQIAVVYDGVCFAADAFLGGDVLAKHGLPYAHDVYAQQTSLDVVAQLPVEYWIPGHGTCEDREHIATTIAINHEALTTGLELVAAACHEAAPLTVVVSRVQQALGKESANLAQYAVMSSAVMAYLQYLHVHERVRVELTAAGPIWECV